MHSSIFLYPDKTYEIKKVDHEKLYELFGEVTFVGALPNFNAFAIGSLHSMGEMSNPFCTDKTFFENDVRGTVVLVGSDLVGEPMDLDCDDIVTWIKKYID